MEEHRTTRIWETHAFVTDIDNPEMLSLSLPRHLGYAQCIVLLCVGLAQLDQKFLQGKVGACLILMSTFGV